VAWRGVPLLAALSLVAAACSSPPATGKVGATLPAMDGTVTLDKIVSPAQIVTGSPGAAFGHALVAAVLTVHSPAGAASKFAAIYTNSRLIDSKQLAHIGKSTAVYDVTDCASYTAFGALAAGQSQTGCVVFQTSAAVLPVELKITGKANADWTIPASAIQAGTPPAPAPAPLAAGPTASGSGAPGTTPTTGASPTGTTGNTGTGGTSPSTVPATAAHGPAPPITASAVPAPRSHRRPGAPRAPKILRVIPTAGVAGDKVQIWGKRLGDVTQVTFNGVPALIARSSASKIVVVVPTGASAGYIEVIGSSGVASSPMPFPIL
jgi:hypothetical protein